MPKLLDELASDKMVDSGHGGQTKDLDGDEADGFDEVIYPVDFEKAGHIVDDVRCLILPHPAGIRFLILGFRLCMTSWSSPFLPVVVSLRSLMYAVSAHGSEMAY